MEKVRVFLEMLRIFIGSEEAAQEWERGYDLPYSLPG